MGEPGGLGVAGAVAGAAAAGVAAAAAADTRPRTLAVILFEEFVFPFEVTGVLLLVAVVGLYVMSRKLSNKERRMEDA